MVEVSPEDNFEPRKRRGEKEKMDVVEWKTRKIKAGEDYERKFKILLDIMSVCVWNGKGCGNDDDGAEAECKRKRDSRKFIKNDFVIALGGEAIIFHII